MSIPTTLSAIQKNDLFRIYNYLPITSIKNQLGENNVNYSNLSRFDIIQLFIDVIPLEFHLNILAQYQYVLKPLSIHFIKYEKKPVSLFYTSNLDDWSLITDTPICKDGSIIYKIEKDKNPKTIKSGWGFKEVTDKDAVLVIDRYTENILEIRGSANQVKNIGELFSNKLNWRSYYIVDFSQTQMKQIVAAIRGIIEEIKFDIEAGGILDSISISNRSQSGISPDAELLVNISGAEINLQTDATGKQFWFNNADDEYKAFLSANGTFFTRTLLSEVQISKILNIIFEIRFKSLYETNFSVLSQESPDLFEIYKQFIDSSSYNVKSRFSASYFSDRTQLSLRDSLSILFELAEKDQLEVWYELRCKNPQCERIILSSKNIDSLDHESNCPYCGNNNVFSDTDIKYFFKVKNTINIVPVNDSQDTSRCANINEIFHLLEEYENEFDLYISQGDFISAEEIINKIKEIPVTLTDVESLITKLSHKLRQHSIS